MSPHPGTISEALPRACQARARATNGARSAILVPYLLEFKGRVAIAMAFLVTAKVANVGVPLVLKDVVDRLDQSKALIVLPLALLAAYGLLRLSATLFAELRDVVFVPVAQRAVRRIALTVFRHLHSLSLRFHLERQTGGMTRDIERGSAGISTLLSYLLFSIIPVLLEFALVAAVLLTRFDWRFAAVTFTAVTLYIAFTVGITEWRMDIRRRANELDSRANSRAIDSLINYETVKYFNNEEFEARRYDESLQKYEGAAVTSEASLGILNIGQSLIIAAAVTLLMILAAQGVVDRSLTLGDLVLVNGLLIQLYIPLNLLGSVYRNIKQALTDMDRMFRLLGESREIADRPDAVRAAAGTGDGALRARRFQLRGEAPDPVRRELRDSRGRQGRRGGRERFGQVHARAAALPLLRRRRRAHPGERSRHPRRDAGEPARGDRHRAAGHRALQRHDLLQHPLRAARTPRARRSSRRRARRTSTTSSSACRTATRRGWASAG